MTTRELFLVRGLVEYEGDAYNVPCLDRVEVRELLETLAKAATTADDTEVEHWRWTDGRGEIVGLYRVNWTTFALIPRDRFVDYGSGRRWDQYATPWAWSPRESLEDRWNRERYGRTETYIPGGRPDNEDDDCHGGDA